MASYQVISPPADSGFGAGFGQGVGSGASNIADNYVKYAMLKKFFPNGLYGSRSGSQANPNYAKTIANVIGGVQDPSALDDDTNTQMSEDYRAQNPGQDDMQDAQNSNSDDSDNTVTDEQGNPIDDNSYNNTVRNALLKKYLPGMTMDQVQRKVLGMPQQKTTSDSPSAQFTSDIQDAMNGNQTWDDVIKAHPDKVNNIMKIKAGLNLAKGMNTDDQSTSQGENSNEESQQQPDQSDNEMVSVINPDGIAGQIPKANLDAALKRGFKVSGQ